MAKGIQIFFFIVFCVAALLQYGEPASYFWAPLYGGLAFSCYRFFRANPLPLTILRSSSLAYSLGGVAWFLNHRMELIQGSLAPLYQSLGLALGGFVLGIQVMVLARRHTSSSHAST